MAAEPSPPPPSAKPPTKADFRTFAAPGKGGLGIAPDKTAVLFIEMQNEFTTEGGKLHGSVRDVMSATGMLENASRLAKQLRACGVRVFHAPISFAADGSDNPNKVTRRSRRGPFVCDTRPTSQDGHVAVRSFDVRPRSQHGRVAACPVRVCVGGVGVGVREEVGHFSPRRGGGRSPQRAPRPTSRPPSVFRWGRRPAASP